MLSSVFFTSMSLMILSNGSFHERFTTSNSMKMDGVREGKKRDQVEICYSNNMPCRDL